ncbi:hypothetical protein BV22DRAFT_505510 [Leucogyrophana mollusca]|uniref:Uncharacterized protein n=1 Tax=Leucogyrophana mollusca TaxID=85980 RepID=A0ACB8BFX9_9AGAM|nr:hypothetical protein BV22DRAFT_505510 [Leucogyrophana mollusca]
MGYYCGRCDRDFPHRHALDQHLHDSHCHNICSGPCFNLDYWTRSELEEHYMESSLHAYCHFCDQHFDDKGDLQDHEVGSHPVCSPCNMVFIDEDDIHDHNLQCHHYCALCRRTFESSSNLRNHLNSSTHVAKHVDCPFNGCSMSFVSKSAVVLHLESGACRSGANRFAVDRYIREVDRTNIITDPSRLLTSGDYENVQYSATGAAWNGRAYECIICHSEFRALDDLNRHMASPRHQDKVYRCPLDTCCAHFVTLSGLGQHIESEKCGVSKFKAISDAMDNLWNETPRLGW